MMMNVMIENNDHVTPSVEDLADWADNYGMTFPVVADDGGTEFYKYTTGGLPTMVLLDRGMLITTSKGDWVEESNIEDLLK